MIVKEVITSRHNTKVKRLLSLQKSRIRSSERLFVIEGIKEIEKAFLSGYRIKELFFCSEIISVNSVIKLFGGVPECPVYEFSRDVYQKIAYRENTEGLVALTEMPEHTQGLKAHNNPLYLVLEGVEKPGNLGAIYRTADAAGIDAIILCDPRADIYNPNAIRASLGCVFTVPTVITSNTEAIAMLKANEIQIVSTYLKAAIPYYEVNFHQPTAIVMGTEATGITQKWVEASDYHIIIPMRGMADSMNVSVSTAVVVFEARRQRGF